MTTYNRLSYLKSFLSTFAATIADKDEWWLVIADDGSTDGSREFAEEWASGQEGRIRTVFVQNHAAGIAGQTNSIFQVVLALRPELAFVCNDDLTFRGRGWADAWYDAVVTSGFDHLVFFDDSWRAPLHRHRSGPLESLTTAAACQGAMYTVTPDLLDRIGLFDEANFPVRGHSHIDFTTRACRAGANELDTLWGLADASTYIRLNDRANYQETFDWSSAEARELFSQSERQRRLEVIADPARVRVDEWISLRPAASVKVFPSDAVAEQVLATRPLLAPASTEKPFDWVVVLNLRQQVDRWDLSAAQLASAGFRFERFPARYGYEEGPAHDWEAYNARGLELPIEQQMHRRLIQSPGAWGYLLTMREVLAKASQRRCGDVVAFDDDIRLHKNAASLVTAALDELPDDWVMWYLGSTQKSWSAASKVGAHLLDTGGQADGSFAVALREQGFALASESIEEWVWPYDTGALRAICQAFPDRCLASYPPIAVADVSSSIIRGARDIEKFSAAARWPLEDYLERAAPRDHVHVVVVAEHDCLALRATLDSLRHQDTPGVRMSVLIPANAPRHESVLASAQVLDTRVGGWASMDGGVGVGELNALLDMIDFRSLVFLGEGTVLPRDGIRCLLTAVGDEGPAAAALELALSPTVVDAAMGDRPELYGHAPRVTGAVMFNKLARAALGDARAPGLACSLDWQYRHEVAGHSFRSVSSAGLGLQPVEPVVRAEKRVSRLADLPKSARDRPYWSGQRAPIRRVLSAEMR